MGNFVSVYSEHKQQLIEFAASRGSAGGAELIYSFERICAKHAEFRATVEVFLDIDKTPEIWNFVWDAAPPPEVNLPLLDTGSPAAGYWYVNQIEAHLDCLAGLEPSEEVDELLVVLGRAASAGRGVYVFFSE